MGTKTCASELGFFLRIDKTTIICLLMLILSMGEVLMEKHEIHKGSTDVNIFDSLDEYATSLAKYISDLSNKFIQERGAFTIVFSGDPLPEVMSKLMEPSSSVDWSKWYVFWVDERVVRKTSPQSNYKLRYDELLSKVTIPDDHIISINDTLLPQEASVDYEFRLRQLVQDNVIITSSTTGFPKFDLILLGLGYNGHMASLFPNHPLLLEVTKWVSYLIDSPKPPPERITMTFPVINSASNVAFVVTGKDKARVVNETLYGPQSPTLLPAKMVQPEGELKWFLDKDAASMMII